MITPDADAFSHSALARIAFLLEESAPIASRWLPDDAVEANQVLERLRQVGLEVAALAQAAPIEACSALILMLLTL